MFHLTPRRKGMVSLIIKMIGNNMKIVILGYFGMYL